MTLDHVQSMDDSRNRAEKNGGEKRRRHDLEIAGEINDGDAGEGGKHRDEVKQDVQRSAPFCESLSSGGTLTAGDYETISGGASKNLWPFPIMLND